MPHEKGQQYFIDFTPSAAQEIESLEQTGMTVQQIVAGGLSLMRQVVAGKEEGLTQLALVDDPNFEPPYKQKLLF